MTYPRVTLGGVPIVLHAGAPVQSYEPMGGASVVRLHGGAAVKLRHWRRTAISISGSGWMNPGLDGLDYDSALELRCTHPQSVTSASNVITLAGTPRPDVAPWGLALIGDQWQPTPCVVVAGVATLTAVTGATLYQVCWMPVFQVFCERPPTGLDAGAGFYSWTITAEEV
ncbi:hypothetical protein KRX52_04480 [Pseudomonas sp. MAP12]|uniref:Uncharacterized protein n=1 Tax=Geopseudomonas aromaticivorans TaxID=2849492 RepID=A0ABS6MTB1_9GAMM|nr:hypothetical protein [Pseudomonas aromaticivorans]MBV2132053.1 hypothetical protein [Pseudomonas aromaticivorans]